MPCTEVDNMEFKELLATFATGNGNMQGIVGEPPPLACGDGGIISV